MTFTGKPRHNHVSAPPIAILGTNLVHWIRFDTQLCSLTGSNHISAAGDRSRHNDVSQATDARRPILTQNGQNRRSAAQFNSAATSAMRTTAPFTGWNAGDGVYVWCVARWTMLNSYVSTSNYIPTGGAYDQGATVRKHINNACQFFVNLGGGIGIRQVSTPDQTIGSTNTYYIEGWIDPGAGQIRCSINGGAPVSAAVTNFGLAQPIGRCALGERADTGDDNFQGFLYEVGAAKAFSASAQTAMRQYFAGYYGL